MTKIGRARPPSNAKDMDTDTELEQFLLGGSSGKEGSKPENDEPLVLGGGMAEVREEMKRLNKVVSEMRLELEKRVNEWQKEKNAWIEEKKEMRNRISSLEGKLSESKSPNTRNRNDIESKGKESDKKDELSAPVAIKLSERKKPISRHRNDIQSKGKESDGDRNYVAEPKKLPRVDIKDELSVPGAITEDHMKYERRERNDRRNNIVIRYKHPEVRLNKEELVQRALEKLNRDKRKYRIKYGKENLVCVEVESLAEKIQVMQKKKDLRGSNIWIDDDHTKREIEIQRWLRQVAKQRKEAGDRVSVGYLKIIISGEVWRYNEQTAELEKRPFREERRRK